jgi:hypothetical protein
MKKKKTHRQQKRKPNNVPPKNLVDWEGAAIFSILAGIITGLLSLRDVPAMGALAVGLFVAFAALPHFDAKKWKPRPIVCAVLGGALGCGFAVSSSAALDIVILSGVAGLIIGYFPLTWVPHFSP